MLSLSAMLRGTSITLRLALSLVLTLAAGGLAAITVLPAAALAVAAPIALDAPGNGKTPLIAYDPTTQTTYVAWTKPSGAGIELCMLPAGATGCEGGAPVLLTDSHFTGVAAPVIGGLTILPGGETVVIGATAQAGVGSLAWASSAGGASFLSGSNGLQNGGEPISPVSLFYALGNAAALSDDDVALLDDYGDFFSDSTLTPESPAISEPNSNPGGLFPRKPLETNGPQIAAEPAPAPAPVGSDVVVGVGDNFAGPPEALPGCLNKEGTGYGVSVGNVNGTSKASGTLNKGGLPAYQVLACSAEVPVVAQGGSGIGLVDEEGTGVDGAGSDFQLIYHPFIATAIGGSFGPGVELSDVTGEVLDGIDALDLSEDSGTGVYALWESGRAVIDYSSNGGASWDGPVVSPIPYTADGVIAGVGNGNAEIAYENNPGTGNQVFLQAVNYAELAAPVPTATTLTTSQTAGVSAGTSITVPAGTVGETDHATLAGTNASIATGTVTYGLYSKSSCPAASQLLSSTTAVTSGSAAASSPVTATLAPGTYYWQASYSGDAHNLASTSACGSEVLTVTPAVAIEGSGSSSGTSVTITVDCPSSEPCTVTVTITATEITIVVKKASAARKKIVHKRTITLATGKFTIPGKSSKKLKLNLTKAGKRLLKREHGHLKANVRVSDKTPGGLELTTRTIAIHTVKPKHKK
jgi:hypothetical protein